MFIDEAEHGPYIETGKQQWRIKPQCYHSVIISKTGFLRPWNTSKRKGQDASTEIKLQVEGKQCISVSENENHSKKKIILSLVKLKHTTLMSKRRERNRNF